MSEDLVVDFWLIIPSTKVRAFKERYQLLTPRIAAGSTTRQKLRVSAGDVPIRCRVRLPAALFAEPQFKAEIVVPDDAVSKPVIDATIVSNVQELVRQATGLALTINVENPKGSDQ